MYGELKRGLELLIMRKVCMPREQIHPRLCWTDRMSEDPRASGSWAKWSWIGHVEIFKIRAPITVVGSCWTSHFSSSSLRHLVPASPAHASLLRTQSPDASQNFGSDALKITPGDKLFSFFNRQVYCSRIPTVHSVKNFILYPRSGSNFFIRL